MLSEQRVQDMLVEAEKIEGLIKFNLRNLLHRPVPSEMKEKLSELERITSVINILKEILEMEPVVR